MVYSEATITTIKELLGGIPIESIIDTFTPQQLIELINKTSIPVTHENAGAFIEGCKTAVAELTGIESTETKGEEKPSDTEVSTEPESLADTAEQPSGQTEGEVEINKA